MVLNSVSFRIGTGIGAAPEFRDSTRMSPPPSSPSSGSPMKRLRSQVEEDEEESVCCGICYAERGVSIAGEIDSCKHYFCFVCIMEWAKHESRCPICRQRFSNVRRLPMHGVFSFSRDVKVPHRDQGYHCHGNTATGPVNSYAETKCSICHGGTDEHLLLLCDLCDTASHTYCVGLGYTIPEGDWYCHDCAITLETNTNEEPDQQNVAPAAEPNVTIDIFDIVRETGSRVVRRPRASPLQQNLSSPSVIPLHDRLSYLNRLKGKCPVTGVHRMQNNIQALRANWNSLRSGSLRFHGNSFQPGSTVSQKQDSSSLSHRKLNDSHSMASTSLQQSTVLGGPSNKMSNESVIKDVDKAWKMMDRAKRMQLPHQRTCSILLGVDNPSCSEGARKISFGHSNLPELKDQHSKELELRNTKKGKQCEYSRLNKSMENCRSLKLGEKRPSKVTCEEMLHVRDHTTHSEGYCERPLSRKVHTSSIQAVPCCENGDRNVAEEQSSSACLVTLADLASSRDKFGSVFSSNRVMDLVNEGKRLAKSSEECPERSNEAKRLAKRYCERPLSRKIHTSTQAGPCCENGDRNVAEEQSSSACLVTSADLASSCDKFGRVFSSNRDMDLVNDGKRLAKSSEDGNTRKNDDAKTEIQSLVKLNLKLLTRDKKLGVDTFKVVARQATHTILDACSSETQKSSISSSSPVCSHANETPQLQKSIIMPNCCRQCFYAFVNNVVNSIMLEKVGCA